MDIERVDPELRPYYRRIPSLPLHVRPLVSLLNLVMKVAPLPKAGPGVTIEERQLDRTRVRIFRPDAETSGASLLWIHGGGLLIGTPAQDDRLCAEFARNLGIIVVAAEYRLASREPYPAAIDDCHAAWQWLQKSALSLGVDTHRVALAGKSAGGGLAACLAQRIHDQGGTQPVAQVLFCPMLDDRTASRRELDEIAHFAWNNRSNRAGWTRYLAQPPGATAVPAYAVAARRETLAGLPPTWLSTGDIELFYDEICAYAERLRAAGVPCQLEIVPGAPHGIEAIAADAAPTRRLLNSCYRFLRDRMEPTDRR